MFGQVLNFRDVVRVECLINASQHEGKEVAVTSMLLNQKNESWPVLTHLPN